MISNARYLYGTWGIHSSRIVTVEYTGQCRAYGIVVYTVFDKDPIQEQEAGADRGQRLITSYVDRPPP